MHRGIGCKGPQPHKEITLKLFSDSLTPCLRLLFSFFLFVSSLTFSLVHTYRGRVDCSLLRLRYPPAKTNRNTLILRLCSFGLGLAPGAPFADMMFTCECPTHPYSDSASTPARRWRLSVSYNVSCENSRFHSRKSGPAKGVAAATACSPSPKGT